MDIGQANFSENLIPKLENVYLDSSVFLAHVKEEDLICKSGKTRYEITTNIFNDAKNKKYNLFTSTITLAEVRRLKERKYEIAPDERLKINKLFKDFLEHQWLTLLDVTREIGEYAQDLGMQYGFNPMDAIHISSAKIWDCNVLMVWDKPTILARLPNPKLGDLTVCEPYWEGIVPMQPKPKPSIDES